MIPHCYVSGRLRGESINVAETYSFQIHFTLVIVGPDFRLQAAYCWRWSRLEVSILGVGPRLGNAGLAGWWREDE